MLEVRRSEARGHFDHGWLDTRHTFSFSEYQDPKFMGFRSLRVINEDRVIPGQGFGTHGHKDMEILSYVLEGAIAHKDSLGTIEVLKPGEVQRMTAGSGIRHSEFNPSDKDPLHFLQIWILPEKDNLTPGYEQKDFPFEARRGQLKLLASRDGRDGSLTVHQDVSVHGALLSKGERAELALRPGRYGWVQVVRGELEVNGTALKPGDGVALSQEPYIQLLGKSDGVEVLLFDLA